MHNVFKGKEGTKKMAPKMKFGMAKNRKRDKGQGMVEFALVFPLLLMVTLGIIEFGWMMFSYSAVVTSSREGARYGAAI